MYSINTSLANNYSSNTSLNELLDKVEKKVLQLAIIHYTNIRFANEESLDLNDYQDLLIYKEILRDFLLGCNCLQTQYLIKIQSKIKKLTR